MEFEATESAIPPGWEFLRDSQSGGVTDAQPPANHWYPSRILNEKRKILKDKKKTPHPTSPRKAGERGKTSLFVSATSTFRSLVQPTDFYWWQNLMSESFAFASIVEFGRRLRAKETTAVALTEYFLDRLKQFGPVYNAVVLVTSDVALAQARQADEELNAGRDRGPLHGIPFGVKDLLSTKGLPTTWGAAPLKQQMIDEDATVIVRLREAGAILCAKLAMVELAGGFGYKQADAAFTGPGLNPWDKTCWSGGSSSGSASAVGAGLIPFAIGSETLGSIVTPAGYCGVAGLRPTYGRVSRHGAMAHQLEFGQAWSTVPHVRRLWFGSGRHRGSRSVGCVVHCFAVDL